MNDFTPILLIIFVAVALCVFVLLADNEARYNITQELCSKQQYDFCVVDKVIYKIKE